VVPRDGHILAQRKHTAKAVPRPAPAAHTHPQATGHRQTIHYEIQRYICTEMCTFGGRWSYRSGCCLACRPGVGTPQAPTGVPTPGRMARQCLDRCSPLKHIFGAIGFGAVGVRIGRVWTVARPRNSVAGRGRPSDFKGPSENLSGWARAAKRFRVRGGERPSDSVHTQWLGA
jgi:hypothetical protein